jgi:hypothetical protein
MHVILIAAATLFLGYCIGRVSGPAERRVEYYPEDLHALLAGYGRPLQEHARVASPDNARYATNGLIALAQTCATQDDRLQVPSHSSDGMSKGGVSRGPQSVHLLQRWRTRDAPLEPPLSQKLSTRSGRMNEIVTLVSQKTGLPADKAQMAVQTVVGYLKEKLPAPIAGQIDSLLAGGSVAGGAGGIADTVKGMTGLFDSK